MEKLVLISWRIIQNPQSPVSRIFKARYFRHGDVMQATLGSNPSYIWRSIIWSRRLLEKGLYWKVGDGKSIKTFHDKWVPRFHNRLVNHGSPELNSLNVSGLIKNGTWDREMVQKVFLPYVANEVLSIPIPHVYTPDSRFWIYDAEGKFSVREGYRAGIGLHTPPENQVEFANIKWWRFIWTLTIPPKIRVFWWSLSHDIIPTEMNLRAHHVPKEGVCPLCGCECDTTTHALFFCRAIQGYWKGQMFKKLLRQVRHIPTLEIGLWMIQQLSKTEFESFACRTWSAWHGRNKAVHNTEDNCISLPKQWDDQYIEEYRAAQVNCQSDKQVKGVDSDRIWNPPPDGSLRLDVDAAINEQQNIYGVAGVLRNADGNQVFSFGQKILKPLSVLHAELLAIKLGAQLVHDKGFHRVQIFSDSQMTLNTIMDPSSDFGYNGTCAQEINELIMEPEIVEIKHAIRSANLVAHTLAHFVISSPTPFRWVNGDFPAWLVNLVYLNSFH